MHMGDGNQGLRPWINFMITAGKSRIATVDPERIGEIPRLGEKVTLTDQSMIEQIIAHAQSASKTISVASLPGRTIGNA